ncbi:MAG: sugar ABC transporter permease [bacterium]|nr:sugar ABC transporter permease [bacterium]
MKYKRRSALAREEMLYGYGIVSLWFLGFIVFTAGPIIASLIFSFTEWDSLTPPKFTGLSNYFTAFYRDELFRISLYNTAYYTAFVVPLNLCLIIIIANALRYDSKLTEALRAIYFLPSILPGVASTLIWMYLFNPEYGIVNWVLTSLGFPKVLWLQDPKTSKITLAFLGLWGVGGNLPLFLGALKGIPDQLYEAARIDGSGNWACFRYITLPMLTPIIFFNIVTSIIGTFQVFTSAYIATGGGPEDSTLFYVLHLYNNAFSFFKMGYASSLAWILFLILFLLTIIQFRLSRYWIYYEVD